MSSGAKLMRLSPAEFRQVPGSHVREVQEYDRQVEAHAGRKASDTQRWNANVKQEISVYEVCE